MSANKLKVVVLAERLGTSAGGVEVYERCLLNALHEESHTCQVEIIPVLARRSGLDSLHPDLQPQCRILQPQGKVGTMLSFWLEMRRVKPDVIHACFVIPPILNEKVPVVSTVHDIGFIRFPEQYPGAMALKLKSALARILKRSERIVTVSESTREDLLDYSRTDGGKIVTVYNGLDVNFVHHHPAETDREILKKYRVEGHYILYTGKLEPRKNVTTLVRAYNRLRESGRFDGQLVILGSPKTFMFEETQRSIDDSPFRAEIIQTGYVGAKEVPLFYANAAALCFPSLYEGFGFPVLEAMASGVPVVCSRSTCLPEIVGDAGLLVDPHDDSALADGLAKVIHDTGLREVLKDMGLDRAATFNWQTAARNMIALYQETAGLGVSSH